MQERSSPNLVAVSLLSGLAGAVAALLLAPRSGKETREKIHEQADELKTRTQESLHEAKNTLGSGLDRFSSAINKTGKDLKENYDELRDPEGPPSTRQSPVLHAWEEEV